MFTKIYDLIKNYSPHGENNQCKEVEDGYIFENIFVKNNPNIRPIICMVQY